MSRQSKMRHNRLRLHWLRPLELTRMTRVQMPPLSMRCRQQKTLSPLQLKPMQTLPLLKLRLMPTRAPSPN